MGKIRVQAQYLQPGDVVGSGEKIVSVWADVRTPTGKINVALSKQIMDRNGQLLSTIKRQNQWGKYTMINAERAEK